MGGRWFDEVLEECCASLDQVEASLWGSGEMSPADTLRTLAEVRDELDGVICSDVPWEVLVSARKLQKKAWYLGEYANKRRYREIRARLENTLRMNASECGWQCYMALEELAREEIARRQACECSCRTRHACEPG